MTIRHPTTVFYSQALGQMIPPLITTHVSLGGIDFPNTVMVWELAGMRSRILASRVMCEFFIVLRNNGLRDAET